MGKTSLCCLILSILLLLIAFGSCRPLRWNMTVRYKRSISETKGDIKPIDGNIEKYLMNFGYLPQSDLETGAQRTEKQIRNAIRNLQFFAGLNVTGHIDEPTVDLLKKPRCGVPDVSHAGYRNRRDTLSRVKRYSLQGERWSHTNLTWNLKSMPNPPGASNYIDRDHIRGELGYALDLWARPSKLTFTEISSSSKNADIQVFFHRGYHGDGYPFDGPGIVLAHAFFPGSGRGGDVHFDADETWVVENRYQSDYAPVQTVKSSEPTSSLFAVAAHEFGHSLGLSHSSVDGSLMYPWYSSKLSKNFHLPMDDFEAITHLYGKREGYAEANDELDILPGPTLKDEQHGHEVEDGDVDIPLTYDGTNSTIDPPDKCQTGFDAVSMIRSEMWAFKGKYFWRISRQDGSRQRTDPVLLSSFWYALPVDQIDHIDAVYERPDHRIVFFVGKNFYVLNGNAILDSGPTPLTRIGLPESLEKIDGAFRWGWNGKTYLFSKNMYWRFDEGIQHIELDYPRDLSMWKGVPENFDAVFQYTDHKTYFFKGSYFWEFDDMRMKVQVSTPTEIGQHWLHCPKPIRDPFKSLPTSSASKTVPALSTCLSTIVAFICSRLFVFQNVNKFVQLFI